MIKFKGYFSVAELCSLKALAENFIGLFMLTLSVADIPKPANCKKYANICLPMRTFLYAQLQPFTPDTGYV